MPIQQPGTLRGKLKQLAALFLSAGLLLTACGDSTIANSETTAATAETSDATSPETTIASAAATPASDTPDTAAAWVGEEADLFADEGDELAVIGVRFDDVLNVRSGPGPEHAILTSVPPTGSVEATGRAWQTPNGFWYEVIADGDTGWSATSFLAYSGPTDDATAEITASGGPYTAPLIQELAVIVAETQASEDVESSIVTVTEPGSGDLTDIVVDVVGLADDSVGGYRLHIFAVNTENGRGLDLRTVERTALCARGLSDGLCA